MSRERVLERQVEILADKLALSLMHQFEAIYGTVLLPSREEIRKELRSEPEYELALETIRNSVKAEMK